MHHYTRVEGGMRVGECGDRSVVIRWPVDHEVADSNLSLVTGGAEPQEGGVIARAPITDPTVYAVIPTAQ